jgi:murein DD-endopeptidase MepM/ murein hydrolase activator NlpD
MRYPRIDVSRGLRIATRALAVLVAAILIAGAGAYAGAHAANADAAVSRSGLTMLPATSAVGVRFDTLLVGGYAHGTFSDALAEVGGALGDDERNLVASHLERVFATRSDGGLGRAGRLRLAYERALSPDGTTRSIRVLAAQIAADGQLHTAFYYEPDGKPGYFDPFGHSLDPGDWVRPLESTRVTSGYGLRRMHPILRRVLPHLGTDYAASTGTPVLASADGVVGTAGINGGYGNLVEIRHASGYSTRYAHLREIAPGVSPGALVRQGQMIGRVGQTGLATGPHLHYEVRRNGSPINPALIAAKGGPPIDLRSQPQWSRTRRLLSRLLASAPTMTTGR